MLFLCTIHFGCLILKKFILFLIGGIGYGLIEVIWRGYTHISMLFAGGICFNIFSAIGKRFRKEEWFKIFLLGSLAVTAVEFVFGIIFNLILKKKVWDYSNMPFNILGQVCPLYSLFWGILCIAFVPLAKICEKRINIGLQKE